MGSQWSSNFGNADALRQVEKDFRPVEDLLSLEGNWNEK